MLYLDNRPLTPSRRHAANGPDRFYQWRGFFDDNSELDDIVQVIEKEFAESGDTDHTDRYFLLPVADAESLTDALSKKSRYYEANVNRRHYERNSVSVEIENVDVNGKSKISIVLRGEDPIALRAEIDTLGLKASENTHFGAYLNDL